MTSVGARTGPPRRRWTRQIRAEAVGRTSPHGAVIRPDALALSESHRPARRGAARLACAVCFMIYSAAAAAGIRTRADVSRADSQSPAAADLRGSARGPS